MEGRFMLTSRAVSGQAMSSFLLGQCWPGYNQGETTMAVAPTESLHHAYTAWATWQSSRMVRSSEAARSAPAGTGDTRISVAPRANNPGEGLGYPRFVAPQGDGVDHRTAPGPLCDFRKPRGAKHVLVKGRARK